MPAIARISAAVSLCLGLAGSLCAEDRSDGFLRLMGQLPDGTFASLSPATPAYVDWVAAAEAAGPGHMRMLSGPLTDAPPGMDWRPQVGFSRDDVLAAADNGRRESRVTVLKLDPSALPMVAPALVANGYALSEDRGFPAFWRGEADGTFDLSRRAPDDPFAYAIPLPSRIVLEGELLIQASTWPAIDAVMTRTGPDTAPLPALTTMAVALDLPDWGARKLVQAIVYSDPTIFAPGIQLAKGLVPVTAQPGAVPPWSNLMLADLGDGAGDLTLLVLVYPSKGDAELAAEAMGAGMASVPLASRGDGITLGGLIGNGRSFVAGDGPFAAIYAIETAPEEKGPTLVENRGYTILAAAILTRDLAFLGPALR